MKLPGMKYMDGIIRNWASAGVRTPEDIRKHEENWEKSRKAAKNPAQKSASAPAGEASYDIDLFMQEAVNLTYKKTENN